MAGVGSSGGHTGTRTINVEGGLLVLTSQICDLQSQLYIKIAYRGQLAISCKHTLRSLACRRNQESLIIILPCQ